MSKKTITILFIAAIVAAISFSSLFSAKQNNVLGGGQLFKTVTALDAVTATATSSEINIRGAEKVTFYFSRDVHGTGSSTFSVWSSVDGTNYFLNNKLIDNVTNTNAQTLTRVASKTISATGTAMLSMDLQDDTFSSIKVVVNEVTDGTHSAKALVEY